MRDGIAPTTARAATRTELLMLPAGRFRALSTATTGLHDFFARARPARGAARPRRNPRRHADDRKPGDRRRRAQASPRPRALMRDRRISSLMVVEDGALLGILTIRDISGRVVAEGRRPRPARSRRG